MNEEKNISEIPSTKAQGEGNGILRKCLSPVSIEFITELISSLMRRFKEDIAHLGDIIKKRVEPNVTPGHETFLYAHRLLKKSFYFCTVTKLKIQGGYHSDGEIFRRHTELMDNLIILKEILEKEPEGKRVDGTGEKNFLLSFYEILPMHIYHVSIRKIISEIWLYLRDHLHGPVSAESKVVYNSLRLHLYGLELPSNNPDDYPLHRAVLDGDFSELLKYVNYRCDFAKIYIGLNTPDPIGCTALTMAVKLGKVSFVNFLIEKGASPKVQSHEFRRNAIEEAILAKNKEILKILLLGALDEDQETLLSQHHLIDNLLSTIPDFSCKFKWEVDSKIIPFVRRWAPSDTYFIYKKGCSLRIDFSLYHWTKLKSIRRKQTLLFNAKPGPNGALINEKINLLFIDHETQKYQNVLDQKLTPAVFEKRVDYLIENRDINQDRKLSVNDWVFGPAHNWRGQPIKEQINNMSTTKYTAKGAFTIYSSDKEIVIDPEREKKIIRESFEDYFKKAMAASSWKAYKQQEDSLEKLIEFLGKLDVERKEKKNKTAKQTTQEYFFSREGGMRAEDDLTTHGANLRKSESKTLKKQLNSDIWLAQNVPLKIQDLMPIFDVMATNSEDILQVKHFLQSNFLREIELFPVKCVFPLLLSFFLTIEISDISFTPVEDSKFQLDPNIKKDGSALIEKPHKTGDEDQSISSATKHSRYFRSRNSRDFHLLRNMDEISNSSSMEIPEETEHKSAKTKMRTQSDLKFQDTSLHNDTGENFEESSEETHRDMQAKKAKCIFNSDLLNYTKEKKTLREVYFQNKTQVTENIESEPSDGRPENGRVFSGNNKKYHKH